MKERVQEEKICELCNRKGVITTAHHLIPKEEGGQFMPTAQLCIPCHKQIHALFTNKQLAKELYTIERLQQEEKISKFIKWIQKQPATTIVTIKKSRERRKR